MCHQHLKCKYYRRSAGLPQIYEADKHVPITLREFREGSECRKKEKPGFASLVFS